MNAVERALWFIESHFASEIALEDVAKAAGVSRFT
jgi:AraC family transcriptional regulator